MMNEEQLHLIPHQHKINRKSRNNQKKHPSFVVWFTGLSGSGKSSLANKLEQYLHQKGVHTYILDGDNIRTGLNKDLNFTESGRIENIRRIAEVAKLFVDAGTVVLTAFISPFEKERTMAKDLIGADSFIEAFVDCPLNVCEQRDVKGLYQKARNGIIKNFTGIDSPFEKPQQPDIIISTHLMTEEESLSKLIIFLESKLILPL